MLLSHINTEWFVVAFALKNKAGFSLETEREARAKVSGSQTTQTGGGEGATSYYSFSLVVLVLSFVPTCSAILSPAPDSKSRV